jgi:GT2 family glycosyltransferase
VRGLGILVPFFDGEQFLLELLTSLQFQSCSEWFALIVDDSGTTTGAERVVARFNDPRFSFFKNDKNLGVARCWNQGISRLLAQGDFAAISIVHADDVLDSEYVKETLDAHTRYSDAVLIHSAVSVIGASGRIRFSLEDVVKRLIRPGNLRPEMRSFGDRGLARLLRGNFIFCPTLSFKPEEISLPLFDAEFEQVLDLELTSRLLLEGKTIVGLKRRLYRYRRHTTNLTVQHNLSGVRFQEEVRLYCELEKRCREAGFSLSARVARKMLIIRLHCWYLYFRSLLVGNREMKINMKSILREISRESKA